MTTAGLVRSVLCLFFPAVRSAAHEFWSAPGLRERYPAYLRTMHGLIRASVPLMDAAIAACADLPAPDPCAAPLARYLREHRAEELDHDEWLLDDLAAIGAWQPDLALGLAPSEEVASLVGAQYYWTRHFHPACLLGYIAVLEGCPPDPEVVRRLPGLTGLPKAAFRTLAQHAALDPGHGDDLDRLLDRLVLSPVVAEAVARSAAYTADRAASLLRGLASAAPLAPPSAPVSDDRWLLPS